MARRTAAPSPKAVNFFRRHAGYSRGPGESIATAKRRGALALARAEAESTARGWSVDWEGDPDPLPFNADDGAEMFGAVLRGEHGNMLASKWGIVEPSRDHKRVIAAELALEALNGEE